MPKTKVQETTTMLKEESTKCCKYEWLERYEENQKRFTSKQPKLRYLSTDKWSKGKDKEVLIGFNNTEVTNEGNLSEMVEVEPILE